MNLIAFIVTLAGVLATLGYTGYLYQLDRVAQRRAGGSATQALVRKRMPVALGSTGVGVLGFLIAFGDTMAPNIIGMILAAGAGAFSISQLGQANKRL